MQKIVDARGMACPLPVVNAKKASEAMQEAGQLTILVDNEIAVQNLRKFATKKGYPSSAQKTGEKEFAVTMEVTPSEGAVQTEELPPQEDEVICQVNSIKKGMVVVLSADVMGTGDEKLGKALMKSFVFALTKEDQLPETVLCYNMGAYLSCEDSESLEDLKNLEAEGVQILTCGTCLDFYGIKDKLAVGTVTNMYDIVETMEKARLLIRP